MILREIQLDIPFHKEGNISNEESIAIYEKTWHQKRADFQLMTRCMASMIERFMQSISESYSGYQMMKSGCYRLMGI